MAGWQSGYAADCKSVDLGSTPGPASILTSIITQLYYRFDKANLLIQPPILHGFIGNSKLNTPPFLFYPAAV